MIKALVTNLACACPGFFFRLEFREFAFPECNWSRPRRSLHSILMKVKITPDLSPEEKIVDHKSKKGLSYPS